jgi:hypothetical protein
MPMVKYELIFSRGHRFSGKFNDNVKWDGSWEVKDNKLILNHPISNSTDIYDLPPKREMQDGRSVYKLYGHNEKGEGRVLVKVED